MRRLAGGFFTGKYTPPSKSEMAASSTKGSATQSGSLTSKISVAETYQKVYFHDAFFNTLSYLTPILAAHNLTPVETAFRWLVHHSALKIFDGNDGIILGASSVEQLRGSLEDIEKGPLPAEVQVALDKAWDGTKAMAPTYWHKDLKYKYGFDGESQQGK